MNWLLNNSLAAVYFQRGFMNAAIHEFQETLRINPHNPRPHIYVGKTCWPHKDSPMRALAELQNAVAIEPSYPDASTIISAACCLKPGKPMMA